MDIISDTNTNTNIETYNVVSHIIYSDSDSSDSSSDDDDDDDDDDDESDSNN